VPIVASDPEQFISPTVDTNVIAQNPTSHLPHGDNNKSKSSTHMHTPAQLLYLLTVPLFRLPVRVKTQIASRVSEGVIRYYP